MKGKTGYRTIVLQLKGIKKFIENIRKPKQHKGFEPLPSYWALVPVRNNATVSMKEKMSNYKN
jgi:hypothetical protein